MEAAAAKLFMTEEEYLAFDRASDIKHEFFNGEVYAMAGAGYRHNVITANLVGGLTTRLKGQPCRALASDQRVRLQQTKAYVYPDVTILCGKPQFLDGSLDTLENPTVVIEVLSPSTASEDLTAKLAHYRRMPTVREVVFVDSRKPAVETLTRTPEGNWLLKDFDTSDAVVLIHPGLQISLTEIYDGITWDDEIEMAKP